MAPSIYMVDGNASEYILGVHIGYLDSITVKEINDKDFLQVLNTFRSNLIRLIVILAYAIFVRDTILVCDWLTYV